MKKAMKKLMAALLTVAMVCAMVVPAMAADGAKTGSITIDNAVKGKTYTLYRILDIDSHDTEYNSIVYKTNSDWKNFIESINASNKYFTNIDSTTGVVTVKAGLDDGDAADIASAAKSWLASNPSTPSVKSAQASDTTVTFTDLDLGYYLVVSSEWGDNNADAVLSLDTTKPNATINEKNGHPTIEKKVRENSNNELLDHNDANIGDIVEFQSTITVTDGKPYKYVVTDDMSTGLTFIGQSSSDTTHQLSITVNNQTLAASNYTVTEGNGHTFTVTFHDDENAKKSVLSPNDTVVITYYAVVNNQAVIAGTGNTNKTDLSYNNTTGNSSTTTTYVWQMNAYKYTKNADGTEKALSSAKFVLYKEETGGQKLYAIADTNNKITGWTVNAYDSTEAVKATVFTSPDTGKFSIIGLDSGSYKLEEIKAPDGYNALTAPIAIEITYALTGNTATETVQYKCGTVDSTGEVQILNNAGTTLPTTGGIGTTIFYIIGGGLMVAAAVLLITKKRMENKN